MVAGSVAACAIVVAGVAWGSSAKADWDSNFAVFRALFFVAWITRDLQFLQWMNLRRSRHSLVKGVLFLIIFYVCVIIMLASFGIFRIPERTAFSAFFIPSGVFELDHSKWILRPAIWAAAFIGLQKQAIDELNSSAASPAAPPIPAQT
jgi:hypothetical protein